MAAGNFQACLDIVLKLEGGFSNNPEDKGGPTNLGVTLATLQHWIGKRPVTVQDVRDLTVESVTPIYAVFWKGCSAEHFQAGVDLCVFDWCVNSGVGEGNREVQKALGVKVDGLMGPVTLNTALRRPADEVIGDICRARLAFMQSLPEWPDFAHGWTARVETIHADALKMAQLPVEATQA